MNRNRARSIGKKLSLALGGLVLFILSLNLMKEGASDLAPLIQDHLSINNVANSLGLGWLMACLILSGSPVAVAAVALMSANAISPAQSFTMITGSRLGASFIVLLIGFVYAIQGHERWNAMTAGVLSLILTGSIQLLVVPLGLLMLNQQWISDLSLPNFGGLVTGFNTISDPLTGPLIALLPGWALFLAGIGLVALSLRLVDQAIPDIQLKKTGLSQIPRLVYRPEVMFLLGLAITLVTMSVSISIGILVPLSARGYMRRENIIPYILGANISTLVDTLFAAALVGDPRAISVVCIHIVCGIVISLPLILLAYHPYERAVSKALSWITRRRRNFGIFLAIIFVVPLVFVLL